MQVKMYTVVTLTIPKVWNYTETTKYKPTLVSMVWTFHLTHQEAWIVQKHYSLPLQVHTDFEYYTFHMCKLQSNSYKK